MKKINITYWICTVLLLPSMGYGSIMELMKNPQSIEIITSLGYPGYLAPFLGAARLMALLVIFLPNFNRLKEWAYAGLVFDLIGAIYSQIAFGNPITYTIFPLIILLITLTSYFTHHKKETLKKQKI